MKDQWTDLASDIGRFRGWAPATRVSFSSDWRAMDKLAGKALLSREGFAAMMAAFEVDELSPSTINRRLAALRALVRELAPELEPHIPTGPSAESLPRALSEADAAKVELAARGMGPRDRALFALLYGAGVRISEALSVTWGDLRPGALWVTGKGRRERIVPLLPVVEEAILTNRPQSATNEDRIFPMGRRWATRIVASWGVKAGVHVSPHMLRHSCATALLDGGMDVRMIQSLLGHKNLNTTMIYTKVSAKALQDGVAKSHPLAQRDNGTNRTQEDEDVG